MALRIPPAATPLSLGATWPLLSLIVGSFLVEQLLLFQILSVRLPLQSGVAEAWQLERTDLLLLGLVGSSAVFWLAGLVRHWISPATGAGFSVAGVGAVARLVADIVLNTELGWRRSPGVGHAADVVALGDLVRWVGLVAVAFGLASVVAAVWTERRLRRDAPDWLPIRD